MSLPSIRLIFLFLFVFQVTYGAGSSIPSCPPGGKPRIRREWRTISSETRQRYRRAVILMNSLSLEEGRARFGPSFVPYVELVKQHFCLFVNPKCDVGHFGPNFGFVHRSLVLRFENSVLAIDPHIGAIPYWDVSLDSVDGKFRHKSNRYIFSDQYFGSYQGDSSMNYAITNGMFANFTIHTFESSGVNSSTSENQCIREGWIKLKTSTTCARCCGAAIGTCSCNREEDKYPTFLRGIDECSPYATRNSEQYAPTADGTRDIVYTKRDFDACTSPRNIRSIVDWQRCIENERSVTYFPGADPDLSKLNGGKWWIKARALRYLASENKTNQFMGYYHDRADNGNIQYVNSGHIAIHYKLSGDLRDPMAAPNDPLFWSLHANVDRSLMTWQMNTHRRLQKRYWKYPRTQRTPKRVLGGFSAPFSVLHNTLCGLLDPKSFPKFKPFNTAWLPGTLLGDIASDGYPMKGIFEDGDGNGRGHTFKEIIKNTSPSATTYTYDTLEKYYSKCQ